MPDLPTAAPVFVDPTGRCRKHVRTTAVLSVVALVAVGGLLAAALFGAPIGPTASLPIPPPASAPAQPPPVQTSTEAPGTRTSTTKAPVTTTTTAAKPTTTTTSSSPAVTTTKPANTPPGRPSDLPRPTKPPR